MNNKDYTMQFSTPNLKETQPLPRLNVYWMEKNKLALMHVATDEPSEAIQLVRNEVKYPKGSMLVSIK